MKNYQLVEFLTQGHEHAEVVTFSTLGDVIPAKATVFLTKTHAPRILISAAQLGNQPLDVITLNTFQDAAFQEAIYEWHGSGHVAAITAVLTGLSGEVGAALKQWHEIMVGLKPVTAEDKDNQRVALAHAFWFLSAMAKELGVTLSELGMMSIKQAKAWRRERELAASQQSLPRSGKMASAGDA